MKSESPKLLNNLSLDKDCNLLYKENAILQNLFLKKKNTWGNN